jgi:hypothetical protein
LTPSQTHARNARIYLGFQKFICNNQRLHGFARVTAVRGDGLIRTVTSNLSQSEIEEYIRQASFFQVNLEMLLERVRAGEVQPE